MRSERPTRPHEVFLDVRCESVQVSYTHNKSLTKYPLSQTFVFLTVTRVTQVGIFIPLSDKMFSLVFTLYQKQQTIGIMQLSLLLEILSIVCIVCTISFERLEASP